MDSREIAAELAANNIFVSVRGSAIRVSPHVYNDENDLAKLAAALQTV
jgi:selenocysteine lyase/cysteine desulfurase